MLADKNIHFMAIEGVIGVGKTSLARAISERWNAMFIEENFADNRFLNIHTFVNKMRTFDSISYIQL